MRIKGLHGTREPLFLAPEGRHVYSTGGMCKYLKPQRGDMCQRDAGGTSLLHRFELFAELVDLALHLLLTFFPISNDELRDCNGGCD